MTKSKITKLTVCLAIITSMFVTFSSFSYAQSTLTYKKELNGWTVRTTENIQLIKNLQAALIFVGLDLGDTGVDGYYGGKTKSAVRAIQRYHKIKVDSRAGSGTYAHLNETIKTLNVPNNDYAVNYIKRDIRRLQY